MRELTSRERIARILKRQPVDRIGLHEGFWGETVRKWRDEGHLGAEESPEDHFHFDLRKYGGHTCAAWMDYTEEVLEETDETRLVRNALSHQGFSLVEVISQCPQQYGRWNSSGTAHAMLDWQKEHAVRLEKAAEMSPQELVDKFTIGEIVNR